MLIITNHNRGGLIMKSVDFINKTLEIMLNRYGPFMTVHEYAEVMKLQPDTVYKQIADGTVDVGTIENPNRRKHLFPTALVAQYVLTVISDISANDGEETFKLHSIVAQKK